MTQHPLIYHVDYWNEGVYSRNSAPFTDLDTAKAAAARASAKHMHAYVIIFQDQQDGQQYVRSIHFKHGKEQDT